MHIYIYNSKSHLVGSFQKYGQCDFTSLPAGLYMVLVQHPDGRKERHLITR